MNEFNTVAWVNCTRGMTQIHVIVMYDHDGCKPYVYGVFERADPSNDLTTLIHDAEHDLIYSKVMRDINEKQVEAAEVVAEGER